MTPAPAPVVVVMGVAASGKTTLGERLAAAQGWRFVEGDDYHAPASIAKMRAGIPLDETDRRPWLLRLRTVIEEFLERREPAVIACSALEQSHRALLRNGDDDVVFVYLAADRDEITHRLASREHHFMPPDLADSQFAALEPPADALTLDATEPPQKQVQDVRTWLGF